MTIKQLTLYTSRLQEQLYFYHTVLGLSLTAKTMDSVDFKIGYSTLTLCYQPFCTPYHFAINIPSNKAAEALQWLQGRTPIITYNDKELIRFDSWKATALYFYDKDNNIVEFIARENLHHHTPEPFNQHQLVGISEIGLAVQDIAETFKDIQAIGAISIYDGGFDSFCAVGDEQGLFILVNQNKKRWFPCNDYAHTSDFMIKGDMNLAFYKGKVKRLM